MGRKRLLSGEGIVMHLKYLKKSQYFDFEEIRALQWEKLKKLLGHAYKRTSFYKERFDDEGIQPDAISLWELFKTPFSHKRGCTEP